MVSFTMEQYEAHPNLLITSNGARRRRKPGKWIQVKVLAEQGNLCAYCDKYLLKSDTEWDHFIPYSYSGDNPDDNWVAACRRCNRLKSSMIFGSVDDVRIYIVRHG